MNDEQVQLLGQMYKQRPDLFSLDQVDQLAQAHADRGWAFQRNLDHEENVLREIPGQLLGGLVEGAFIFNPNDKPQTTGGKYAHQIGHLMGFVGSLLPWGGFGLGKLFGSAVGASAQAVGMAGMAMKSEGLLKAGGTIMKGAKWASEFKSVPLTGAELLGDWFKGTKAGEAALKVIENKGFWEQAVKEGSLLGTASAISAVKGGWGEMASSALSGAIMGGAFAGIGNIPGIGSGTTVDRVIRGAAGALVQTLPAVYEGAPTEDLVYDALLGAYFGQGTRDHNFHKGMERFQSIDPDFRAAWNSQPEYTNPDVTAKQRAAMDEIGNATYDPKSTGIGLFRYEKRNQEGFSSMSNEEKFKVYETGETVRDEESGATGQILGKDEETGEFIVRLDQTGSEVRFPVEYTFRYTPEQATEAFDQDPSTEPTELSMDELMHLQQNIRGRTLKMLQSILPNVTRENFLLHLESINKVIAKSIIDGRNGNSDAFEIFTAELQKIADANNMKLNKEDLGRMRQEFIARTKSVTFRTAYIDGPTGDLILMNPDTPEHPNGQEKVRDPFGRQVEGTHASTPLNDIRGGDTNAWVMIKGIYEPGKSSLTPLKEKQWDNNMMAKMHESARKQGYYIFSGLSEKSAFIAVKNYTEGYDVERAKAEFEKAYPKFMEDYQQAAYDYYNMGWGTVGDFYTAFWSNVRYWEEFNGKSIGEMLEAGKPEKEGGKDAGMFIKRVLALNKRLQPMFTDHYPMDARMFGSNQLTYAIIDDFAAYMKAKGITKENTDGAIIIRDDILDRYLRAFGMDDSGGFGKAFILDRHPELGALIGKFAFHGAGPEQSASMREQGLDMMIFTSSAKQRGLRNVMRYSWEDDQVQLHQPATGVRQSDGWYTMPAEAIRGSFQVGDEALKNVHHVVRLARQLFSNFIPEQADPQTLKAIEDFLGKKHLGTDEGNAAIRAYEQNPTRENLAEAKKHLEDMSITTLLRVYRQDEVFREHVRQYMLLNETELLSNEEVGNKAEMADHEDQSWRANAAMRWLKLGLPSDPIALSRLGRKNMETAEMNFFIRRMTAPYVEGGKAIMRVYDLELQARLARNGQELTDDVFYLDEIHRLRPFAGIDADGNDVQTTLGHQTDLRDVLKAKYNADLQPGEEQLQRKGAFPPLHSTEAGREIIADLAKKYPFVQAKEMEAVFSKHGEEVAGKALGLAVEWSRSGASLDTPPHEYAHVYVDMFQRSAVVAQAIKDFGSKEKLVQAIGEYYADRATKNEKVGSFLGRFWRQVKSYFGALNADERWKYVAEQFYKGKSIGEPGGVLPIERYETVFHGSPHDFQKFMLDKVNTGEGAQAYGWGLYFTSSEKIARSWYAERLAARLNADVGQSTMRLKSDPSYVISARQANEMAAFAIMRDVERATPEQMNDLLMHKDDPEMLAGLSSVSRALLMGEWRQFGRELQDLTHMFAGTLANIAKGEMFQKYYGKAGERILAELTRLHNAKDVPIAKLARLREDLHRRLRELEDMLPEADVLDPDDELSLGFAAWEIRDLVDTTIEVRYLQDHFLAEYEEVALQPYKRNLYTVDINKSQKPWLHWNEEVSPETLNKIGEALQYWEPAVHRRFAEELERERNLKALWKGADIVGLTGQEVYTRLQEAYKDLGEVLFGEPIGDGRAAREASRLLENAGFAGMKYIGRESGQLNYVMYDDAETDILSHEQYQKLPPKEEPKAEEYRGLKVEKGDLKDKEGRAVGARYDRATKTITVNEAGLKEAHARYLSGETRIKDVYRPAGLENFEDFKRFSMEHEYQHSISPRDEGESLVDYESRINRMAERALEDEGWTPSQAQAQTVEEDVVRTQNRAKMKDTIQRMDKRLRAVVLRVPMDALSGAQSLRFAGFTGRKGGGILLSGKNMQRMGGADLDIDSAFFYFNMPDEVHNTLGKYSDEQSSYNELFPHRTRLFFDDGTQDLPLWNSPVGMFDPYHRLRTGYEVSKGRGVMLPRAVSAKTYIGALLSTVNENVKKQKRVEDVPQYVHDPKDPQGAKWRHQAAVVQYWESRGMRIRTGGFDDVIFVPKEDNGLEFRANAGAAINDSADAGAEGKMVDPITMESILLRSAFEHIWVVNRSTGLGEDIMRGSKLDAVQGYLTDKQRRTIKKPLWDFTKDVFPDLDQLKQFKRVNQTLYGWNSKEGRGFTAEEMINAARQYPASFNHHYLAQVAREVAKMEFPKSTLERFMPMRGMKFELGDELAQLLHKFGSQLFPKANVSWKGIKDRMNVVWTVMDGLDKGITTVQGRQRIARNDALFKQFFEAYAQVGTINKRPAGMHPEEYLGEMWYDKIQKFMNVVNRGGYRLGISEKTSTEAKAALNSWWEIFREEVLPALAEKDVPGQGLRRTQQMRTLGTMSEDRWNTYWMGRLGVRLPERKMEELKDRIGRPLVTPGQRERWMKSIVETLEKHLDENIEDLASISYLDKVFKRSGLYFPRGGDQPGHKEYKADYAEYSRKMQEWIQGIAEIRHDELFYRRQRSDEGAINKSPGSIDKLVDRYRKIKKDAMDWAYYTNRAGRPIDAQGVGEMVDALMVSTLTKTEKTTFSRLGFELVEPKILREFASEYGKAFGLYVKPTYGDAAQTYLENYGSAVAQHTPVTPRKIQDHVILPRGLKDGELEPRKQKIWDEIFAMLDAYKFNPKLFMPMMRDLYGVTQASDLHWYHIEGLHARLKDYRSGGGFFARLYTTVVGRDQKDADPTKFRWYHTIMFPWTSADALRRDELRLRVNDMYDDNGKLRTNAPRLRHLNPTTGKMEDVYAQTATPLTHFHELILGANKTEAHWAAVNSYFLRYLGEVAGYTNRPFIAIDDKKDYQKELFQASVIFHELDGANRELEAAKTRNRGVARAEQRRDAILYYDGDLGVHERYKKMKFQEFDFTDNQGQQLRMTGEQIVQMMKGTLTEVMDHVHENLIQLRPEWEKANIVMTPEGYVDMKRSFRPMRASRDMVTVEEGQHFVTNDEAILMQYLQQLDHLARHEPMKRLKREDVVAGETEDTRHLRDAFPELEAIRQRVMAVREDGAYVSAKEDRTGFLAGYRKGMDAGDVKKEIAKLESELKVRRITEGRKKAVTRVLEGMRAAAADKAKDEAAGITPGAPGSASRMDAAIEFSAYYRKQERGDGQHGWYERATGHKPLSSYELDLAYSMGLMHDYEYSWKKYMIQKPYRETGKVDGYWMHSNYDETLMARYAKTLIEKAYKEHGDGTEEGGLFFQQKRDEILAAFSRLKGESASSDGFLLAPMAKVVLDGDKPKGKEAESTGLRHLQDLGSGFKAGNTMRRESEMPGYSMDPVNLNDYAAKLAKAVSYNFNAFFAQELVRDFEAQNAYGEQTRAWGRWMRIYVRDTMGLPSVFTDDMLKDPLLNIQRTPYYWLSDHAAFVHGSGMNKAVLRLFGADRLTDLELARLRVKLGHAPSKAERNEARKAKAKALLEFNDENRHNFARILKSLSSIEARYELATLLSHPKSAVANMLGGTVNNWVWTGGRFMRDSWNVDVWRQINPQWQTLSDVYKWIESLGVVENYITQEGNEFSRTYGAKWKAAEKEIIAKLKKDPEMPDATVAEILRRNGITDSITKKGAWFMTKTERVLRLHTFMSAYLQARASYDTANLDYSTPHLIEVAKRGVAISQFLYNNANRPAFARTNLGKVYTRFKLWGWSSVRFQKQVYQEAKYHGFEPGSVEFERFQRLQTANLFMIGMASLLPYTIFNNALPPPFSYFQGLSDWMFGNDKERENAFYGKYSVLPTALAPMNELLPSVWRVVPGTADALEFSFNHIWGGAAAREAEFHSYTMFPFGRLAKDLDRTWDDPARAMEYLAGIPFTKVGRLKKQYDKERYHHPANIF